MSPASGLASATPIESRILALQEQRVILDADLAVLYDEQTKVLVQAVKRNVERFPADFMTQLSAKEWAALRSQTVTSNTDTTSPKSQHSDPHGDRTKQCARQDQYPEVVAADQ
jgi:hypothetical protein